MAHKYGDPKITKDGVTVAKNIQFSDPQLVRDMAKTTNDKAGDETTAASLLTLHIFGCEKVAGFNSIGLSGKTLEIEGMGFDQGYLSPHFTSNRSFYSSAILPVPNKNIFVIDDGEDTEDIDDEEDPITSRPERE